MLGGSIYLTYDLRPGKKGAFDPELATAQVKQFKELRSLTLGDFYPLTPISIQPTELIGYQFHREDLGQGFAVYFRRAQCGIVAFQAQLVAIDTERDYEVTVNNGEPMLIEGSELSRRFVVTIDETPGSALVRYTAVE